MHNLTQPQEATTAVAVNRARTISLRATEQSIPVELRIQQSELRYGGAHLATQIMNLATRAGREAGAAHRIELEAHGVPAGILNALRLATRRELIDEQAAEEQSTSAPTTWMRSI